METFGIIGQGFVGNAVYQGFKKHFKILTYDLDKTKCNSTLKKVVEKCDIIFVCVPSPMSKNGSCDLSIVNKVLYDISLLTKSIEKTIVLKSTVPPGTCDTFNEIYAYLNIVFNPEFLTAANAVEDFENQDRIILGGDRAISGRVGHLYKEVFSHVPIFYVDNKIAEMVKYVTNTFLSTKVSFANEIYDFCQTMGLDYNEVVEHAMLDKRLGESHWRVPGPDGDFGFGGTCFPKDINALIFEFERNGVDATILKAAWNKNTQVRNEFKK